MRRIRMFFVLGWLAVAVASCHAPVTVVTPQGQAAYKADQVVQRVNELQNAAIDANAGNALDVGTTRLIVQFCVDANRALAATPQGWLASVNAAWASLNKQLPLIRNAYVRSALNAVDVVLAAVGGGE